MEPTDRPRQHLTYPDATMFELVDRVAKQYPDEPAYESYNKKTSYAHFIRRIERSARAFWAFGVRPGDAVTICLPNIPQALDCFYAVNRIGAVCNMVHPLSAQNEIVYYLNVAESRVIVTVDLFYEKVAAALQDVDHPVTILTCRMQNELPLHLAALYLIKKGKDYLKFPQPPHLLWSEFLKQGDGAIELPAPSFEKFRTAVILYSGGTTGVPKGICLTDLNFNACAMQAMEAIGLTFRTGLKMLSCMPLFHGFGLGINIHTVLIHGACCVLMPTFNPKTYAQMLRRKKPNFIAGVPTIFEALLHMPQLDHLDMGFLMGMFCGGDSLSVELKKKIDAFLREHHASIQVREGYGLTECVTASCLTPRDEHREGSIGLPFPDTVYAIVKPGTAEFLPPNTEGEIILKSAGAARRGHLALHRRSGVHGRGRVRVLPPAVEAAHHHQRLQHLPGAARKHHRQLPGGGLQLRHRREGPPADAAGEGLHRASRGTGARRGAEGADHGSAQAPHRPIRPAEGDRIQNRAPQDPGGKGGLPAPRRGRGAKERVSFVCFPIDQRP